jgi:hypothetical protein
MPDGSSSAAPVMRPGPSRRSSVGTDLAGARALSFMKWGRLDAVGAPAFPEWRSLKANAARKQRFLRRDGACDAARRRISD